MLLDNNQAQVARNCVLWHGSMRPLSSNLEVPNALVKQGTIQTIYRFGQEIDSDSQYWFHWTSDVDVCRGQVFDDVTERTFYTDGVQAKVTDNSIALAGGTAYPMNGYILGIPAPANACTVVAGGTGNGVVERRVYTYTYVDAWGNESQPAEPASAVDIIPGQTANISLMATGPVGNYNVATKRIYRSVTSGTDSGFYFVAEIPVANPTYTDSILAENLGEQIGSVTFAPPPADMLGITPMANGMMAGFKGKEILFCEPYKPHAYPIAYRQLVDHEIVGIAALNTTLVVLTKGFPSLIQGTHPSAMAQVQVDTPQACVSKRSIRVLLNSVVYASPDGLFSITGNGPPVNLTELLFTNKEWRAWFNPSSIHGYVFDDKYFGFFNNGSVQGGFILDPKRGDFTLLDFYATAGFYDPHRDALFLVVDGDLVKFDAGATALVATWRSKVFWSPAPISMSAIRVEAASYPVVVKVIADGRTTDTVTITSNTPQRLKSGFKANKWEFELATNREVFSVDIGQTISDLVMING